MSRTKVEKNIAWDDKRECYYVTLYFGKQPDGKIPKKYVTTTNKKEAQRILRDHNKLMEAGTAVVPVQKTLVEYATEYINFKSLSLSETTIYGYKNILQNHLAPYFAGKTVQDIKAKDIQDYITEKASKGKISLQSIKKHVAFLDSVLENAYKGGIINDNPAKRLEKIKTPSGKMECLNASEISALCERFTGTQLEVPVKLAAYLGLRRGEVLGLKWEHVDFENSILYINNTRTQAGKNTIEKEPKTERSIRQLYLTPELITLLRQQKEKQRKILTKDMTPHEYVVFMDNGRPFKPNYLTEAFSKHLAKQGIKHIRFHDLRHSFASIANDAGITMSEISSAMGHSNINTTSTVYTHEFSKTKTKAVSAVAMCIEQAKTVGYTCERSPL